MFRRPVPFRAFRPVPWAPLLALILLSCQGGPGPAPSAPRNTRGVLTPPGDALRLSFTCTTTGPAGALPAYAVITGLDASGRACRLDRSGRLLPCTTADNVVPGAGGPWCDYAIPIRTAPCLELDRGLTLAGGRIYLSVGAPPHLRVVDTPQGPGLVQPDPANPGDPDRDLLYDWVELALDSSGFHGNTTCVDQFGLPVTLAVTDRADPERPLGPVGLSEARSALFRAYRASVPPAFAALAAPGDTRILAPAHGGFGPGGPDRDYLQGWIDAMWDRYRSEPLVLTPDQGRFTGTVDARDWLVFTRDGDPGSYAIRGKPTTQEAFLGDGLLAAGSGLEKVLGAQIAALLNRHLLDAPGDGWNPAAYYRRDPCNHYARFWHQHGLGGLAYGFAYDDVQDQSSSLATPDPLEISITFRWD